MYIRLRDRPHIVHNQRVPKRYLICGTGEDSVQAYAADSPTSVYTHLVKGRTPIAVTCYKTVKRGRGFCGRGSTRTSASDATILLR